MRIDFIADGVCQAVCWEDLEQCRVERAGPNGWVDKSHRLSLIQLLSRILKDLYGKFRWSCKLTHPVAFGLVLGRIQFSLDREPTFFPL